MSLIFVYGTLKRGGSLNGILDGSPYIGPARILGFGLWRLRWFPAIFPLLASDDPVGEDQDYAVTTWVDGEVYEVDASTLRALDRVEGHPRHYRRERIERALWKRDFSPVRDLEAYVYPERPQGERIPSGIWPVDGGDD